MKLSNEFEPIPAKSANPIVLLALFARQNKLYNIATTVIVTHYTTF